MGFVEILSQTKCVFMNTIFFLHLLFFSGGKIDQNCKILKKVHFRGGGFKMTYNFQIKNNNVQIPYFHFSNQYS